MKRIRNIEQNRKELERLGLKAPAAKRIVDVEKDGKVDGVQANQDRMESTDSTGTLPTNSIGKYCYKLTPSDLKREQQAFEAGEGVHALQIYMQYN